MIMNTIVPPTTPAHNLIADLYGDVTPRNAYREAIAIVALKAKAKLPECNGRVDAAVKLVLAGDVELLADGTAKVGSRSDASKTYTVANKHCDCRDYEKAPHNFCKHRLAYGIARRAQELTAVKPQPPVQAVQTPLPEAPASVNVHIEVAGRQVQLTLRGTDENQLLARLEAVLQRFPVAVQAEESHTCPTHGVAMVLNHGKDGRSTWWSHRTAE